MLSRLWATLTATGVCVLLLGCGAGTDKSHPDHDEHAEKASTPAAKPGHEHPAEGPRGGHLIELGAQQYHAEVLHDEATHSVTVHLLDASGKEAVSADEPHITLQLFKDGQFVDHTLKAADGTSEFSLADEELCDTLLHADEIRGRLHVTIGGTQHIGMIEHQAHEHEGHDDDHGTHEDADHDADDHDQGGDADHGH